MTADELCAKYEVRVNKFRTRPKSENEIIVDTWARVTTVLEEKSFNEHDAKAKRALRLAAREIRHALAHAKHVTGKDAEVLQKAEKVCYSTMHGVLEEMVVDVDEMARLIMAKHVQHRRLNAVRTRLVRAINVMADNIETLNMGKSRPETK